MQFTAAALLLAATAVSATPLAKRASDVEACPPNPDGTHTITLVTKQEAGHEGINMNGRYPTFFHINAGLALITLSETKPEGTNLAGKDNFLQFKGGITGFWGLETDKTWQNVTSPSPNFLPVYASGKQNDYFGIGNDGVLRIVPGIGGGEPIDSWKTWVACDPTDTLKKAHNIQDPILLWTDKDLPALEYGTICNKVTLEVDSCDAIA